MALATLNTTRSSGICRPCSSGFCVSALLGGSGFFSGFFLLSTGPHKKSAEKSAAKIPGHNMRPERGSLLCTSHPQSEPQPMKFKTFVLSPVIWKFSYPRIRGHELQKPNPNLRKRARNFCTTINPQQKSLKPVGLRLHLRCFGSQEASGSSPVALALSSPFPRIVIDPVAFESSQIVSLRVCNTRPMHRNPSPATLQNAKFAKKINYSTDSAPHSNFRRLLVSNRKEKSTKINQRRTCAESPTAN